ncbi:ATP-binding cassette sub-family A member 3 [Nymphon striatum]|nr:ATP-binding cassette sub-family A member 3 [Nymphon striatum]
MKGQIAAVNRSIMTGKRSVCCALLKRDAVPNFVGYSSEEDVSEAYKSYMLKHPDTSNPIAAAIAIHKNDSKEFKYTITNNVYGETGNLYMQSPSDDPGPDSGYMVLQYYLDKFYMESGASKKNIDKLNQMPIQNNDTYLRPGTTKATVPIPIIRQPSSNDSDCSIVMHNTIILLPIHIENNPRKSIRNEAVFAIMFFMVVHIVTASVPAFTLDDGKNIRYRTESESLKMTTCLLPNMNLYWIFRIMLYLESKGIGAHYDTLSSGLYKDDPFTLSKAMWMMVASWFIQLFIIWYFDGCWPWQTGVPKPFHFPFMNGTTDMPPTGFFGEKRMHWENKKVHATILFFNEIYD